MSMPAGELVALLATPMACHPAVRTAEARCVELTPALLDALDRAEYREPYDEATRVRVGLFGSGRQPIEVVLDCLTEAARQGALREPTEALLRLARDEHRGTRWSAGGVLGAIASDACVEGLRHILLDPDRSVAVPALRSLAHACEHGRASSSVRSALFEVVAHRCFSEREHDLYPDATCLIALDRERAARVLCEPPVMGLSNRGCSKVLKAMRESGVAAPVAALEGLIAQHARLDAEAYCEACAISEALLMLATLDTSRVTPLVPELRASPSQRVRRAAAQAACTAMGITDPYARVERDEDEGNPTTEAHRIFALVRDVKDQVDNGGVSQYFVNGFGREWSAAVDALGTIGAPRLASALRSAAMKMGSNGPDLGNYDAAVAGIHQRDDDPFDAEDKVFSADEDDFEVRVWEFIAANPEDFR
ncbi:MAG: DUF4375 domain-containing protein [Phycisphaerales bacterium]|nr:DUF4375 domain-containing protein [Phycisphaerales bacterium]